MEKENQALFFYVISFLPSLFISFVSKYLELQPKAKFLKFCIQVNLNSIVFPAVICHLSNVSKPHLTDNQLGPFTGIHNW